MYKSIVKKWLYGTILSMVTLVMLAQISLAAEASKSNEKIGMGRIKCSHDDDRNKSFVVTKDSGNGAKIIVYAAFTSDTASSVDDEDLPAFLPVLNKNAAYMYIAFRVTKTTTAVDIKWNIDGPESIQITEIKNNFNDPVTNGSLVPGFWYFTWLKLDPDILDVNTVSGTYDFQGKIRLTGSGWGNAGKDSCIFQVVQ